MYVQASNVIYAHICGNQRSVSDVFPKEPFALLFKTGSVTGNLGLLSGLLIRQGWLVSKIQGFLSLSPPLKLELQAHVIKPRFYTGRDAT